MVVTAMEFKSDVNRYLSLVANEDIFIANGGQRVAKLSGIKPNKADIMKSLFGIIPDNGATLTELREERLSRYENVN